MSGRKLSGFRWAKVNLNHWVAWFVWLGEVLGRRRSLVHWAFLCGFDYHRAGLEWCCVEVAKACEGLANTYGRVLYDQKLRRFYLGKRRLSWAKHDTPGLCPKDPVWGSNDNFYAKPCTHVCEHYVWHSPSLPFVEVPCSGGGTLRPSQQGLPARLVEAVIGELRAVIEFVPWG